MIVFLTGNPEDAAAIGRGFTSVTPEVDGPFNLHLGHWRGRRAAVYVISEGADMAYAAARLAVRRGATALVPLPRVLASGMLESEVGDILPVGSVWDLAGLKPLLRLLPDSAAELPMEIAPLLPSRPVWSVEDDLPGIGTLPFPAPAPILLEALSERRGIQALDVWCAGAAEAAVEEGVTFRPHMLVEGVISPAGVQRHLELHLGRRRDEQLAGLLGLAARPPAGSAPPAP